ncbi:hypothetical protein OGAPHI_007234 [Ogataea philodendri]|uniref:Alpha-mannosidase n=1 Tax=Ogataea philodendri TaxID=1378263 RepID=A0A9P8NVY8_9ASCO|nr:uncharacterized protein OGAPHI_007234 [Ogataea philodendri]KAH3660029.1 hypothetical protein OGAPHI_007234 [Ogataea philodendri]
MTESTYPQLNVGSQFKPVDSIYENRLRQFIDEGGQYSNLMLPKFYTKARIDTGYEDGAEGYVELRTWAAPGLSKPLFRSVIPSKLNEFKPAHKGDRFGPAWSSHWFEIKIKVPDSWAQYDTVLFKWDSGTEGLLFSSEGTPLQGLTGGGERVEFELPESWRKGEQVFYLEIGCNGMSGSTQDSYELRDADLVVPNLDARALYYDFWMIGDSARELQGAPRHKAREIGNRIMDTFDSEDESSVLKCREIAREFLGPDVDSEKVYAGKMSVYNAVYAIGNCHIDTAWLWDFATSKTKIARSWSTQLRMIDQYPEYVFAASAAQHFKWLKKYYPDLFKKVISYAQKGRFVPVGGSWVENDTNLPSGEGLVRQFLLGQRWFQDLFGFKSDTYWLPDSFGYSSQIPQLSRLAEMPNFLTQKLSWNNINQFPENTFNWVGIDSSQVLVHMPPANTYTADANFGDVKRSISGHHNLYNDQKGLLLYGKGDGGGGPTPSMLERLRRIRGLAENSAGEMPTVESGINVTDFYNLLRKGTDNGKSLPSWRGELYLEFHRGTYTSQAHVKDLMRTSELLMRDLEYLATKASLELDYQYPHKKIDRLWQDICLCQFHDVLPGSCIEKVYHEDVWPMLERVQRIELELISEIKKLFKPGKHILNSFGWERAGIVKMDGSWMQRGYTAVCSKGDTLVPVESSKSVKYRSKVTQVNGTFVLENGRLRATIDSDGVIVALYDILHEREVLDTTNHRGIQYVLLSDTPLSFPAWDTELFSREKFRYVKSGKVEILENGPLVSSLKIEHDLSDDSKLTTIISLDALQSLSERTSLKFDCHIDWHETYKFLKIEVPVSVNNDFASYETQFGITKRPTHFNTSWDVAKFECCCHKFVDYSDFNYGVSILNNNKYGANVHGNLMTLSLMRAPKSPDAHADMGEHSFKFAVFPHSGPLGAQTVRAGWEFNERLGHVGDFGKSIVSISGDDNLIISNIKRGEDDSDLKSEGIYKNLPKKYAGQKTIVLRIYEALGGKAKAKLTVNYPVDKVFKTNILEEEKSEVSVDNNSFIVESRGFEISTYKVILKN